MHVTEERESPGSGPETRILRVSVRPMYTHLLFDDEPMNDALIPITRSQPHRELICA